MSIREILEDFVRHTDSLDEKDDDGRDGFERDFAELKQRSLEYKNTYSSSAGQKLYNGVKNRYKDILPFEYTRVPLQPLPGLTGSDYINANYVKGVSGHNTYIAAQAPLPTSVIDFWRMIWENEVKVVLMACNLREAGKTKCEKYWPELDREVQFGDLLITLTKEDHQSPDYTLRELEVRKANICKVVYQLHYTAWPDHGVPDHYDYILDLVAEAREKQQQETLPIVVHCSAGCGRTGTIIAIDYCWSLLKKGKLTKDFNLFNVIDEMRRQRPSAVQTPDQYWFVFMAVRELFERHLRIIERHSYENVQVGEGSTYEKEDSYDPYENVDVFESTASINQEDDYAIPEPAHGVVQAAASPFKGPSKPPQAAPARIHPAEIAIEKTVAKLASKQADFLVPDSSGHVPRHPPEKGLGPSREERREEYVNVDIPKSTMAETGKPLLKTVVKRDPLPVQGQTEVQKRDEYVNVDLPKRTSIKEMDPMPAAKATVARKPSNESRNLQVADGVDQSSSYTIQGGTHVNAKVKSFEKTQSSVDASSTRKSSADTMQKGHQAVQDSSLLKGQNVTVIAVKGENQEGRIFDRKDPVSPVMPYAIGNVHLKENAHYEAVWPVQKEQNLPTQEAAHIQISSKEDDARSQSVSELRQKLGSDLVLGSEQGKKSSTSEDHHKLNPLQKLKNKISGEGNLKSADHKKKKSFDEDKDHSGKDQHSKPHHEEKGGPLEHLKSAFQLGCGSCVSVDPAYAAVMQSQNAPLEKPPPHGVTPASDGFMKELKAAQGGLRTAEPENRASTNVNQQQHGVINKTHPIPLPSGVRKSQPMAQPQAVPYAVSNVQLRNSTHETVTGSHASSSDDIQPYASSSEFGLKGKTVQRGHNSDFEDEAAAPYSVTSEMGLFGRKKQENSFPSKSSATPPVAHEYADPFLDSQSTVSESSGEYAEPYSTTRELFGKRSSQNDARPPALIPKIEETKEPNSLEYSYSFEHCKQMPLSSPKGFFDNSSVGGPNPKAPPRKKRSSQDGSPQGEGQTYEPVLLKSSERDVNPPGSRENRPTEVKQPFQRPRAVSEDDDKPPPIPTKSEGAFLDVSQVKSYKRRSWDDKIWAEKYSCPPPVPIKTPEAYMLPRTRGQHYDGVMRYPPMTRSRSSTDNKYHSLERNFFSKKDVSEKPEESGPESGGKPKTTNVLEKLMSKVPMKSNKGREPSLPSAGVSTPAVFIPFKTEFPHRNERKPQGPRPMVGAWKLP
ncbi:uncharacterized protein LOC106170987 isoform X2 [Lingula anatina]|uniref:protein-tyrosine-phosphatase n=1 Tax=Lingula anatina TaxID=7574 RepID=A0A1S3J9G6_LINAN|nr:uncharacterized protein LOC106170987 isoform X2 [Lingula anatina]|eukprot:XP_013406514.1 uncharacterized protein LOC106170987 isoform X2 [Lingula anatina]